jgi:hippurate hydrolase
MPVKNRFAELHDEIAAWRQDFHKHPELGFEVHRTAGIVAEKLREFGCDEVVEGIGITGVVAVIKGKSDSAGRTVGLRADMDALPIPEQTGADYASVNEGKMHACGHDGHTAMLLGAAKYLAETRNFDGTAVMIFQPAEEGGGGGEKMVQDGMMDRWGIQEIYAIHNMPGFPLGEFRSRTGPITAAGDSFEILLEGKGGHAAQPHKSVDTMMIACHMALALQTIPSRNTDPVDPIVLSVTSIESSSKATNVIPQQIRVKGTLRTMSRETRLMARQRIEEIATGTASMFGGTATLEMDWGYPASINTAEEVSQAAQMAEIVSGKYDELPLVMGSEDFSYMLEERPGAFIMMGIGEGAALHHPEYNFNDEAIPYGCSWFAEMIERRMPAA